jgi:hypothetical protein
MYIPASAVFFGQYVPGRRALLMALVVGPVLFFLLRRAYRPVCGLSRDHKFRKRCNAMLQSVPLNTLGLAALVYGLYSQFHAMHYNMVNVNYVETMKSMAAYARLFPNVNINLHNHSNDAPK